MCEKMCGGVFGLNENPLCTMTVICILSTLWWKTVFLSLHKPRSYLFLLLRVEYGLKALLIF